MFNILIVYLSFSLSIIENIKHWDFSISNFYTLEPHAQNNGIRLSEYVILAQLIIHFLSLFTILTSFVK